MATRFIFSLSRGLVFPFLILGFLIKTKVLSLSSGVHFYVVNYVYGSLQPHVHQFHYFWRDYSILLLLFMIFDTCLLACYAIATVCIYRHLLFVLVIPLLLPWILLVLFLRAPFLNNYYTGPTLASFLHHKVLRARPSHRSTLFHLSRSFRLLFFFSLLFFFFPSICYHSFLLLSSSPFGVISIRSFSFIPFYPRVYAPDISRSHTFISLLFHY